MTIYDVKAVAMDRKTHKRIGHSRTEVINTATNSLFHNAHTKEHVKMAYEAFWNELNPHSKEIVKVLNVKIKKRMRA